MPSTQVEEVEVVSCQSVAGAWSILRVKAPQLAALVQPGQSMLIGSRGLSAPVMRAKAQTGAIDLLFRNDQSIGENEISYKAGDRINISLGVTERFQFGAVKAHPLLIGERLGIAPIIFLAEALREREPESKPLVFIGTRDTFPFRIRPSTILLPDIPDGVIACMPLLEEWGIPSRLANREGAPGCFDGSATALAALWLRSLDQPAIEQVELFASGNRELIRTATELAQEFAIPCQTVEFHTGDSFSA
jgi:dihydroorotate dehydrogenase electron transfer subunit